MGQGLKIFPHLQKSLCKGIQDVGSSSNLKQADSNSKKKTHMGEFGGKKVQGAKLHLFCVGDRGDGSRESNAYCGVRLPCQEVSCQDAVERNYNIFRIRISLSLNKYPFRRRK